MRKSAACSKNRIYITEAEYVNMFKDFSDELSGCLNILTVLKTFYDCGISFSDTEIKSDYLYDIILDAMTSLGCWLDYNEEYDCDLWYI